MMTLTRYGLKEWGSTLVIALLLIAVFVYLSTRCWTPFWIVLAVVTLVAWLALAAFFRNPARDIPADPALIVSPADGVVKDIGVAEFRQEPFSGEALRIGIFLYEPFDFHRSDRAGNTEFFDHFRVGVNGADPSQDQCVENRFVAVSCHDQLPASIDRGKDSGDITAAGAVDQNI